MVPGAGAEGEAVLVQEDRGTQAVGTWGSYSTVLDITWVPSLSWEYSPGSLGGSASWKLHRASFAGVCPC
jgi:hypothetical protein